MLIDLNAIIQGLKNGLYDKSPVVKSVSGVGCIWAGITGMGGTRTSSKSLVEIIDFMYLLFCDIIIIRH